MDPAPTLRREEGGGGCAIGGGDISRVLEVHPGPVSCLRVDASEFPPPERLQRWMEVLSAKKVRELILINLTAPEETEAPLHYLRSRLTSLTVGFLSVRESLRLAFDDAAIEGHAWSSLTDLTLTACAFDGPDLSNTVSDLQGLKNLCLRSCTLTDGCMEESLSIASRGLVSLQLWRCTAVRKLNLGHAPALTHLSLGVLPPAPKAGAASPPLSIEIKYCSSLCTLEHLDLKQQDISIWSHHILRVRGRIVFALEFVRTLAVAVEMGTADHALNLFAILRGLPHLKNLTVKSLDDDTSHGLHVCPPIDSVRCLANSLQCLTMLQFRRGDVELMFVTGVLSVARSLMSLTVEMHTTKTPLHREDTAGHLCSCDRASKECQILVLSAASGPV